MPDIRLADGTFISTEDGKRTVNTEVNQLYTDGAVNPVPSNDFAVGTRRFLDDLPMPFLQSKPVAIVAAYSMFGLTVGDISRILNVPPHELNAIRNSEDYIRFMDSVLQNVREHDTNKVRKKLTKNAKYAASKVVALMDSESEKIALAAAQDVLNRTGHKASDTVEHKHSMDGGITIRVIKDTKTPTTIDVGDFNG